MIPLIKVLEKDQSIELTVLLMTYEEQTIAEENQIQYQMLDDFTERKRTMDFDLGWGLAPMINALERIQPDLFIAIEVNYILRNAIRYCKQHNIPNIVIQHGTPNEFSLHAFAPFEGECFAAWGEFTKEMLIKNHVDPSRIVVVGGIPFDRTVKLTGDKQELSLKLGIDPTKKWIVFATQPNGPGNRPSMNEIIQSIMKVTENAKRYSNVELVFQVHPHQDVSIIEKIVSVVPNNNAVVLRYRDTEELLAASDGLITFFSTTAIDAVILKKPLMLINLTDTKEFLPFGNQGIALTVFHEYEIPTAFDCLVSDVVSSSENYDNAIKYMNAYNDGKALDRVLSLCYEKLKKGDV